MRARRYPWGIVEVDNPKHSDFGRLRNALLNSHLTDLKEITHGASVSVDLGSCGPDFLYENYRTEKLSRSVNADVYSPDSSILPEDMATQSVRLKEEQLRKESEKLKDIELRVQREISEKRQELIAKVRRRARWVQADHGHRKSRFATSRRVCRRRRWPTRVIRCEAIPLRAVVVSSSLSYPRSFMYLSRCIPSVRSERAWCMEVLVDSDGCDA